MRTLAALTMAATLASGCGTTITLGTRGTIKSKPNIAAGVICTGMLVGWVATGVVSYKIADGLADDGDSYRPTIFVPLALVVDVIASVGALTSAL